MIRNSWVLLGILVAGSAFCGDFSNSPGAFATLRNAFQEAKIPAHLEQFDSMQVAVLKPLSCLMANQNFQDSLTAFCPIQFSTYTPGTPDQGPLFPGTPSQRKSHFGIVLGMSCQGAEHEHKSETAQRLADQAEFFSMAQDQDDLVLDQKVNNGSREVVRRHRFRTNQGLILMSVTTLGNHSKEYPDTYGYCWR